jgi:hypothetical protein
MKKIEIDIDCVKLQRELREQADKKYRDLSLSEEVAEVRKGLRKKGLWRLFERGKPGPFPRAARRKKEGEMGPELTNRRGIRS